MIIYNLEYSILDKLGRAKSTNHVGIFKTDAEIEAAKERTIQENSNHKVSFKIFPIENIFSTL
jgi:hypothetical protein